MPDREKVIREFRNWCEAMADECPVICIHVLDLLKEQEAVKPKTTITYNGFHYDYCGNCGRLLPVAQDFEKANYCPSCGRMVDWDA